MLFQNNVSNKIPQRIFAVTTSFDTVVGPGKTEPIRNGDRRDKT